LVEQSRDRFHDAIELRPRSNHFDPIAGRKNHAFPNR
jgi:hypothetical protein